MAVAFRSEEAAALALFLALACGRSDLSPGELQSLAVAGSSGAGGKTTAGTAGRAGSSSTSGSGGRSGTAGAPVVAGMPGEGGSFVVGGEAGETGEAGEAGAPVVCDPAGALSIEKVTPPNGTPSFDSEDFVKVRFDCPYAPASPSDLNVRLFGQQSGYVGTYYGGPDPAELWIDPKLTPAFFPGERVTAWLGPELGGPYLWQYTERVSAHSPGQFVAGPQDLTALSSARDIALGDIDGDHDLDLLIGSPLGPLEVWRNQGNGTFVKKNDQSAVGAPVLADVDHDGDLDVLTGGPLLLNFGDGIFGLGPELPGCVVPGDFDGDGDLDCIKSGGYRPDSTVYGNVMFNVDGRRFDEGPETPFGFDCEAADLDGDADLDVVCVSPVATGTRAFFNDGKGAFLPSAQKLGKAGSRAMAIGDVDGDHDIDVVVAVWYGGGKYSANELWLNDGSGTFSQASGIGSEGGDIELGDLDGDGDLDVVVSELTPYGPSSGPFHRMHVYENDGKGGFHDTGRTVGDPAFQWFELGDLDGDGDLDAFVFHQIGNGDDYSAVWLNQK
jgi:hypothetical protein